MLVINELDIHMYPELTNFLRSEENLDFLQREYLFVQNRERESVSVLEIFAVLGTPEQVDSLLQKFEFTQEEVRQAFEQAANNRKLPNAYRLLEHPGIFAHFEKSQDRVIRTVIRGFVERKVVEWGFRKSQAVQIDIDPNEVDIYIGILRSLIHRNTDTNIEDIDAILSISRIRRMKHETALGLYLLAQEVKNHSAVELLKQLPNLEGVDEDLAHQNEDLRATANDVESSIRGLTDTEIRLQQQLQSHYGAQLKVGDAVLLEEFKAYLQERYEDNPAVLIQDNGFAWTLPFTWEDFEVQAEILNEQERARAMKEYFKHEVHTAHRWLSKPNHWIKPNATYAERNDGHPEWGSYANFEQYIPLIVRLWVAAKDENSPPINGQTLQGRVDFFIKSLALIGRGHNWDQKRNVMDPQNPRQPLRDKRGNVVQEEYDDLRLDDPSCYSGVNRRIAIAVVGHALLTILTHQLLREEIHHFIHEYYVEYLGDLSNKDKRKLKEGLDQMIIELEPPSEDLIKGNIPQTAINEWIKSLRVKYGTQFDQDGGFQQFITKHFTLGDKESHISNYLESQDLGALLIPDDPKALFTRLLARMEKKVVELEQEAIKSPKKYQKAAQAGRGLLDSLKWSGKQYFAKDISKEKFIELSNGYIDGAQEELQKHRGWSEFIRDLMFFFTNVLTVGVASGISYLLTGKIRFFEVPPTDSMVRLQRLKTDLVDFFEEDELMQQPPTGGLVTVN